MLETFWINLKNNHSFPIWWCKWHCNCILHLLSITKEPQNLPWIACSASRATTSPSETILLICACKLPQVTVPSSACQHTTTPWTHATLRMSRHWLFYALVQTRASWDCRGRQESISWQRSCLQLLTLLPHLGRGGLYPLSTSERIAGL